MITSADLRERVKMKPFTPFRIWTSSGQFVDVLHPEFIMVGRRIAAIGKPVTPGDEEFDLVQQVSILHITSLEPLESGKAATA